MSTEVLLHVDKSRYRKAPGVWSTVPLTLFETAVRLKSEDIGRYGHSCRRIRSTERMSSNFNIMEAVAAIVRCDQTMERPLVILEKNSSRS